MRWKIYRHQGLCPPWVAHLPARDTRKFVIQTKWRWYSLVLFLFYNRWKLYHERNNFFLSWIIHTKNLLINAYTPYIYDTHHMPHLQLLHELSLKFWEENFYDYVIFPIYINISLLSSVCQIDESPPSVDSDTRAQCSWTFGTLIFFPFILFFSTRNADT